MSDAQGPNMSRAWNLEFGKKLVEIYREERNKTMTHTFNEQNAAHVTPDQVERKPFHLHRITNFAEDDYAYLFITIAEDNAPVDQVVVYNYPPSFSEVMAALASVCPLHMVGFEQDEEGLKLASAESVWGFVCPCSVG